MDDPDPATIPLGDWWRYGFYIEATCQSCGASRDVPNLVQSMGTEARMDDHKLAHLSHRLVCGSCGARGPALTILRRQDTAPRS